MFSKALLLWPAKALPCGSLAAGTAAPPRPMKPLSRRIIFNICRSYCSPGPINEEALFVLLPPLPLPSPAAATDRATRRTAAEGAVNAASSARTPAAVTEAARDFSSEMASSAPEPSESPLGPPEGPPAATAAASAAHTSLSASCVVTASTAAAIIRSSKQQTPTTSPRREIKTRRTDAPQPTVRAGSSALPLATLTPSLFLLGETDSASTAPLPMPQQQQRASHHRRGPFPAPSAAAPSSAVSRRRLRFRRRAPSSPPSSPSSVTPRRALGASGFRFPPPSPASLVLPFESPSVHSVPSSPEAEALLENAAPTRSAAPTV